MEHRRSDTGFLGRLDPGTRLLAAAGAAVCFSLVQHLSLTAACLGLSLLLLAVDRPPLLPLLKRLALANLFVLFLWLTVPLTVPGEVIARLGPLSVSREGVLLALTVSLKCNAILLCSLVFLADLGIPLVGYALERLRVPKKLVFLFLFTCRHVHVIGEEWRTLQTAARLRGFVPCTSLHTYRTIGNMLGLCILNSIDRSQGIYEAMLLRGFSGTFHTVTELHPERRDGVFSLLFFLAVTGILAADIFMKVSHV